MTLYCYFSVAFLQEPGTKLACKRLGIIPDSLKPRSLQSFREGPTDTPDAMEIK